jgi:Putative Ice-binding-like adhesive domain
VHEAHGDLFAIGGVSLAGAPHIFGHVDLVPPATLGVTGSATVGDTNFAGPGIEPGWTNVSAYEYEAYEIIPDAPPVPNVSWNALPAATVFGSTNLYILDGGGQNNTNYYTIPSGFNLSGGDQFIVTNGTIFLKAAGSFAISAAGLLQVGPNACVVAWFNGDTALSGGGVVNQTGNATNVTFYGTTNCTRFIYSGSSSIIGTIYSPEADITWSSGSPLIGSSVAKSFNDSGGASIHFDESLLGGRPVAAVLDSLALNAGIGQFQFNVTGVTGLVYAIQTSTNLVDWYFLQTNASPFTVVDTNVNHFPQRFYRAFYLP